MRKPKVILKGGQLFVRTYDGPDAGPYDDPLEAEYDRDRLEHLIRVGRRYRQQRRRLRRIGGHVATR